MQDKTIDGALLALRKRMIRGDGEGLAHVEALLSQRGVDMPAVLPPKRKDAARHGAMRRLLLEALRHESMTLKQIAAHVDAHRPEIGPDAAYKRACLALNKMRKAGLVRNEKRVWGLENKSNGV